MQRALAHDWAFECYADALRSWIATVAIVEVGYVGEWEEYAFELGARDYLDDNGFVLTDPPVLTPAACEGTSTLFPVDYFGDEAFLTQSGQLYIESTALALGKVYSFGPTFRAEKSKTRRHLTEFWMVEPEVAYLDLEGNMDLAEDFLASTARARA